MPPEFSRLALRFNADIVGALTYIGADGREIVRPPGLSDLPGGAAVSATVTALLGFAFATRANATHQLRLCVPCRIVIGLTVVYLTQVRSMLVMICICMLAAGAVRLRQGRVAHSAWVVGSAAALVIASFTWAVAVGGESVSIAFNRFSTSASSRAIRKTAASSFPTRWGSCSTNIRSAPVSDDGE